jgi:hypothetical protein
LYQRSKFAQTASALKSVPSWNFTPSCRVNVHFLPSSDDSHSLASAGTISVPPASVVTSVSKSWRTTRNDSPSLT